MFRGLGSAEFVEAQRRLIELGCAEFLRRILLKSHADIDEWQTQMQLKPMAAGTLLLYSTGLSAAQHALTGIASIKSVRSAVLESIATSGDLAVAVIPEGPYVVLFAGSAFARSIGGQKLCSSLPAGVKCFANNKCRLSNNP